MKAFLAACVTLVLIAVCASLVLNRVNESVEQAYSTAGVRI